MKALIVAALLVVSCSPVGSGAGATSPAISPPVPTVSATPSPTPSPPPGFTRYTNAELGFSVDLPAGWRRATCSQGVASISPLEASEWFVAMPENEEFITGGVRMLQVRVGDAEGLTPLGWLERDASQPDARVEPAVLGGRTGARGYLSPTGDTYAFALAERGWIYAIEYVYFGFKDSELERTIATLQILDDATVGRGANPTPAPRSVESLADSIADGFARKDVAAIAEAMAPCVTAGVVPGHPELLSRAAYLKSVAEDFAAGTTVAVQSRPIESDPNFGRFVRSTWSKPGEPDQRVDLLLSAKGDRWSLAAILIRAPGY